MSVPRERLREGRTVERRSWTPVMFGPGMILGALGTAGVILSMFLPWRDGGVHPSDIPVEFLWDRNADSDLSLLIVLIPLAVVLAIGAFVPMGAGVRLFGAVATLVVVGAFAYQLNRAVDAFGGGDLTDVLDTGFYVAAAGGLVALVSGMIPSGWKTRREVVRSDVTNGTPA
jgi:hypothetical protein